MVARTDEGYTALRRARRAAAQLGFLVGMEVRQALDGRHPGAESVVRRLMDGESLESLEDELLAHAFMDPFSLVCTARLAMRGAHWFRVERVTGEVHEGEPWVATHYTCLNPHRPAARGDVTTSVFRWA